MKKNNNVSLRALEPQDVDFLYNVENDYQNWSVSSNNLPFSKDALSRYISNADQDIFEAKQFRFVIESNGRAAGLLDVFDFDPIHLKAGVGIFISPSQRKNGIAIEALKLLKKIAIEHWKLHQLYAHIGVDNEASIRLFIKSEFIEVGILKDWQKNEGTYLDFLILQQILND